MSNKPTLTEKDAVLQSLDLWLWLFKNPGKYKNDYPDFNIIQYYLSCCPLCELNKEVGFLEYIPDCKKCFGRKKSKKYRFESAFKACFSGAYLRWTGIRERRYAGYIASKIRRFAKKQGYIAEKNLTNNT